MLPELGHTHQVQRGKSQHFLEILRQALAFATNLPMIYSPAIPGLPSNSQRNRSLCVYSTDSANVLAKRQPSHHWQRAINGVKDNASLRCVLLDCDSALPQWTTLMGKRSWVLLSRSITYGIGKANICINCIPAHRWACSSSVHTNAHTMQSGPMMHGQVHSKEKTKHSHILN